MSGEDHLLAVGGAHRGDGPIVKFLGKVPGKRISRLVAVRVAVEDPVVESRRHRAPPSCENEYSPISEKILSSSGNAYPGSERRGVNDVAGGRAWRQVRPTNSGRPCGSSSKSPRQARPCASSWPPTIGLRRGGVAPDGRRARTARHRRARGVGRCRCRDRRTGGRVRGDGRRPVVLAVLRDRRDWPPRPSSPAATTARWRITFRRSSNGTSTATLILNGRLDAWDPAAVTLTAHRTARTSGSPVRQTWCSTGTPPT